jgi:hypothetical protein
LSRKIPYDRELDRIIMGIVLLPASITAGLLRTAIGPVVPFAFGASLSLASALILAFGLPQTTATLKQQIAVVNAH